MRQCYTSVPLLLLLIISAITPFNKITKKWWPWTNESCWWLQTLLLFDHHENGKGLCQFSKGLPHSAGHWGGPPPLVHPGRRDFFRPQGDRGPGGVGLHCAWPGQPGWGSACSGGPSAQMSAHTERTLESDGKKKNRKRKPGSLR